MIGLAYLYELLVVDLSVTINVCARKCMSVDHPPEATVLSEADFEMTYLLPGSSPRLQRPIASRQGLS